MLRADSKKMVMWSALWSHVVESLQQQYSPAVAKVDADAKAEMLANDPQRPQEEDGANKDEAAHHVAPAHPPVEANVCHICYVEAANCAYVPCGPKTHA